MSHGPVFYLFARTKARQALRAKGYSFRQINSAMDELDDDSIDVVAEDSKITVGAIGDGSIIAAIIAFFQSEQGQALIKALVEMLIALIGGL